MYTYRTLEDVKIDMLHEAFMEAFSDYTVKLELPFEKFQNMMIRRGYSPAHSVGAFDGDRLIGFVLNGVREWNGNRTAYDCGTGVVPDHRKKGVTTTIMNEVMLILKDGEIGQYLLEVIQVNEPAVELYRKQGFTVTRTFSCFRGEKAGIRKAPESVYDYTESKMAQIEWDKVRSFRDFEPSWQNSIESISAVPESFHVVTAQAGMEVVGYGLIDKKTGDIPQIAVHPDHRLGGIGLNLLSRLIPETVSRNVELINIDDRCLSLKGFLESLGIGNFVDQYEMILKIQPRGHIENANRRGSA